jgi:AcrR family transcriptional regulator
MPSAPRTARALARAELTRAILERASVQLAEVGPAALSVRQIARDLEMASSAVYRYFPSRDALLTALLIRAFDDMGAVVEDGAAYPGTGDP